MPRLQLISHWWSLGAISNTSLCGQQVHTRANATKLSNIFVNIAGGQDVAHVFFKPKWPTPSHISEAVADGLAIQYLGYSK